jgi:hypothetical protein
MTQHFLLSAAARSLSPAKWQEFPIEPRKMSRSRSIPAHGWQAGVSGVRLRDLLRLWSLAEESATYYYSCIYWLRFR